MAGGDSDGLTPAGDLTILAPAVDGPAAVRFLKSRKAWEYLQAALGDACPTWLTFHMWGRPSKRSGAPAGWPLARRVPGKKGRFYTVDDLDAWIAHVRGVVTAPEGAEGGP